jgi:hypothetical protein
VPVEPDDDQPIGHRRQRARGRRPKPRGGRHARPGIVRPIVTALFVALTGLGIASATIKATMPFAEAAVAAPAAAARADEYRGTDVVSRDFERSTAPDVAAIGTAALPAPAPVPVPVNRAPVAGLTQTQMDHAVAIVEQAKKMNLPRRASVVAIATALQESQLRNHANNRVPASLRLPHEGLSSDFDSIGLFQQRPSQGWGTAAELMTPAISASRFFDRLVKVQNWPNLNVGDAAQAVQRSAFPDAYDKHRARAEQIVTAIF